MVFGHSPPFVLQCLSALNLKGLGRALRVRAASRQGPGGALALDGKAACEGLLQCE